MVERGFQPLITIKEAIENIDKNIYLLPAIQRKFVWSPEQIESLFDSIMRKYPINSLMLWQITSDEIKNMITAYGCGVGNDFDIEKARYHKIVIMTDADVDGAHIRTLLLTFFFRYMRPLIENGYVYAAQPPLYKVKKQKKEYYVYTDKELEVLLEEIGRTGVELQRYKGLGEMNAEQLWDTTMNPETRTLLQVTIEDAVMADQVFSMLMGDKVGPRKEFIEENATYVTNLDI